MPSIEGRILFSLCPLVNIDLFKRGHYHVRCKIHDQLEQCHPKPLGIKDIFGGGQLSVYTYPGASVFESHVITQTSLIEYTEQSFVLGEYFLFKHEYPVRNEHTELYVPAKLLITLELMYNGDQDLPEDPETFECVATRTISLTIDWRRGMHAHWPVIFDYFHMAAVGVTLHASLYSVHPEDYIPEQQSATTQRRAWFNQATPRTPPITYHDLLFGVNSSVGVKLAGDAYQVPTDLIRRAREIHKDWYEVITSARDSLRHGFQVMSGQYHDGEAIAHGPLESGTTLEEVQEECNVHLVSLSLQLQATWEWFCRSVVSHPDMMNHLAKNCYSTKLKHLSKSVLWPEHDLMKQASTNRTNGQWIPVVATSIRKLLASLPQMYCVENIENSTNSSVLLIDPCPWPTRRSCNTDVDPQLRYSFQDNNLQPYLLSSLPIGRHKHHRSRAGPLHLVVCVHGLQGNQFDLRLYRTFLELALPHQKLEFMMSQANQSDTFIDFNIMTDRLQQELLERLVDMPHPPTHISFMAHSLGGIVVRSLVTRPEVSHLIPLLHLFLSICGPHLGTQQQTGVVSAGMWVVRKWYQSQSLLQLSLKDSPNLRDTFLYHLSESQTFECFRHVVLLTSPQDKYVPHQSAHLYTNGDTSTALSRILEEMASNMLLSMEQFGVDLVRVTVHHSLPTSAHSVIGRAAHIAMLDNDLFVEKFILCHIAKYFV